MEIDREQLRIRKAQRIATAALCVVGLVCFATVVGQRSFAALEHARLAQESLVRQAFEFAWPFVLTTVALVLAYLGIALLLRRALSRGRTEPRPGAPSYRTDAHTAAGCLIAIAFVSLVGTLLVLAIDCASGLG